MVGPSGSVWGEMMGKAAFSIHAALPRVQQRRAVLEQGREFGKGNRIRKQSPSLVGIETGGWRRRGDKMETASPSAQVQRGQMGP